MSLRVVERERLGVGWDGVGRGWSVAWLGGDAWGGGVASVCEVIDIFSRHVVCLSRQSLRQSDSFISCHAQIRLVLTLS